MALSDALQKAHEARRKNKEANDQAGISTKRKKIMHTIRCAKNDGTVKVTLTRSLAIKAFCTECSGEEHPKDCPCKLCALYPFRGITRIAYGEADDEPDDEAEEGSLL